MARTTIEHLAAGRRAGIDPASLTGYQIQFDARQITGVANGASLSTWPDSSGHSRNAQAFGNTPIYRLSGGVPWVDFDAGIAQGTELDASVGSSPLDMSAGVSLYACWWVEALNASQSNPAGFSDMRVAQAPAIHGFAIYAQRFTSSTPGSTDATVSATCDSSISLRGPSLPTSAGTGFFQSLSLIAAPPAAGAGAIQLWVNGVSAGSATNWQISPSDNLSNIGVSLGNAADNDGRQLKAKIGYFAFASRSDSDATRQGIEAFFRSTWGNG